MTDNRYFSRNYFLTPGECNAQSEMPLWLLVEQIIEVGTLHANSWGVGYARLIEQNRGWVLSRLAVEMKRYPSVNEHYTLTTWVESYNRRFSERLVEITDENGEVIGNAVTVWVVIDYATRTSCDISELSYLQDLIVDKQSDIQRPMRIRQVTPVRTDRYRFRYADIDFNRHVNSWRYVCLLMNRWSLEFHDKYRVERFEISYMKEGHEGEEAIITIDDASLDVKMDLAVEGESLVKARVVFVNR